MTTLNVTADVGFGECEGCQETRPVWRYVPLTHLFEPDSYSCLWCLREVQPLLCGECTVAERAKENARPASVGDLAAVQIFATGSPDQRRAS